MAQMMGVLLISLPILGVKFPQTSIFWGMNRRFEAKWAKFQKFHIIETTASISTKFCTMIETTVVIVGSPNTHPTNRRWRMAAILKKTLNALYLQPFDFDEIWHATHIGPLQRNERYNFEFLKIQDGGGAILKITKIATSPQWFD